MGIAVAIGALADLLEHDEEGAAWLEEDLAAANGVLAQEGLPAHAEPRTLQAPAPRTSITSFPYSYIHYLRRAYAHRLADPSWIASPLQDNLDPADDPLVQDELDLLRSHLICHSDAEGFYLPIDFADVLIEDADEPSLPGAMLGSSYRLLEELCLVAPTLGIRLSDGQLADDEAARIDALAGRGNGIHRELCAWLALYEAARLSIELKTAIVFS